VLLPYLRLSCARAIGYAIAFFRHPVVVNLLVIAAIIAALAALDRAARAPQHEVEAPQAGQAQPIRGNETRAAQDIEERIRGALATLWSAIRPLWTPQPKEAKDTWLKATTVLAAWALVLIAWWVARQRRRLLIARFDDMGGGDLGARGLSLLLANELAQLRDLFQEFEEGSVIQSTSDYVGGGQLGRSQLFEATVQVDAPVAFLESTISAESTLALGPVKIPLNVLLGLVNRLVQGPRLAGQVQMDGGRRIVTIEFTTGSLRRQWRVEDEPAGKTPRPLAEVARDLAYRMIADLAFERPVRWASVSALIKGLHAYRRTLRTTKEGRLNLHEAENHLQDAVAEDNRFHLAYYNLGVVYAALGQYHAALSAFARATALDPERFGSHYALARVRYMLGSNHEGDTVLAHRQFRYALDHCDQAIVLARSAQARAKALNLKALAQIELRGMEFFRAAAVCRLAVKHAWRALLAAELSLQWRLGTDHLDRRLAAELVAGTMQILHHIARTALAVDPSASPLLRLLLRRQVLTAARTAAWLRPTHYESLRNFGSVLLERGRVRAGIRVLRRAIQLAPTRGDAWCLLASACARQYQSDWVSIANDKTFNSAASVPDAALADLAAAWQTLADTTNALRGEVAALDKRRPSPMQIHRWTMLLAGHRVLTNYGSASEQLRALLRQRGEWVKQLEDVAAHQKKVADRVSQFITRRAEIQRLSSDPQDRSQELTKLYEEAKNIEELWEAGDSAAALGRLARSGRRFDDERKWIVAAIEAFDKMYPTEVVRRGLYANLSRALRSTGDKQGALNAARKAVTADPLSSFERDQLADCHFELREWALARRQWEESLRLTPDEPTAYHNIALCWFNEGMRIYERERRTDFLKESIKNLGRAQTLYSTERGEVLDIQFLLGRIRAESGDARGAQALWLTLESRSYRPLYLGLHLADVMLRAETLREAEVHFRRLSAKLEGELGASTVRLDDTIDAMPGDPDPGTYGTSAVWAALGISLSLARRNVAFDDALKQITKARTIVPRFADADLRAQWTGNCDRTEGIVLFLKGDAAHAIPFLEKSIASAPHAAGYYYLAAGLLEKLDAKATRAASRYHKNRICALADLAEKNDIVGEYEARIIDLRTTVAAASNKNTS